MKTLKKEITQTFIDKGYMYILTSNQASVWTLNNSRFSLSAAEEQPFSKTIFNENTQTEIY